MWLSIEREVLGEGDMLLLVVDEQNSYTHLLVLA